MKNIFFTLCILLFVTGCSEQKLSHQETVMNYYKARDASDYKTLKTLVSDSITITEGDFVMPYSRDSFYEQFKWDSVLRPSYKVVEIKEENDEFFVDVAYNSIRNKFLENTKMKCQYKISFISNKISKIETLECRDVDWVVWQTERDSLVSWIKKNQPELDGFINDMTMKGALNYLKAIEAYENARNNL